jgi:DNA-binding transcriptional MerR regulator
MKDPAFLFYDGDAARDVSHMNRLERGAYFDLIQAQRKFGGLTVEQIRKVLGKDFEEVWPALELILYKTETDKFYIEWVQVSIENRKQFAERQRKRIQDYWNEKKNNNDSNEIPRNNHGITTDIPLENENEIVNENIIKYEIVFDNFRKNYPGTKRGLKTEFENYKKKHKDWKEVLNLLLIAVDDQIKVRELKRQKHEFVPEWKNLSTWINQRCWEEETEIKLIQETEEKVFFKRPSK